MTSSTSPRRRRVGAVPPAADKTSAAAPPPWTVYILLCADGTLYTGCTSDLPRRLRAHQGGQVKYTRGRLPIEPIHQEPVEDRSAALRREAAIKRLSRKNKLALPDQGRM